MTRAFSYALVAIALIGGVARFLSATVVPLIFDEYQWIAIAERISLWPLSLPLHGDAHPAGSAYAVALGSVVAGGNLIGYRLASVVAGTALIWIVWRLGTRQFGQAAGLAAAALVAGNEYLLGVSRLATEKSVYLALSAAAVLAFLNAVERRRTRDYACVGIVLGLGLMMKEILILWVPLLAWELVARRGWRALFEPGPRVAAFIIGLAAMPDLVWNMFLRGTAAGLSDRGLVDQVSRMGLGWNFGPTALFLRPAFQMLEAAVSEYPAITSLPGALLLGGAAGSLLLVRDPNVRMWLRLGWGPFLFFSFLGSPRVGAPEFWWADLSIVPFVLLTVATVAAISPLLLLVAVSLTMPGAGAVTRGTENCYPLAALSSGPILDRCYGEQRAFIARFPDRDHAVLSRVGSWRLPVAAHYERWGTAYLSWLSGRASAESVPWPDVPAGKRPDELKRIERMLQALGHQE